MISNFVTELREIVTAEYRPSEADLREAARHSSLSDALRFWPELTVLIQTARMIPEMCDVVEAFDGYAEAAPVAASHRVDSSEVAF